MTTITVDIAVIGGGVVGAGIAYHLATAGASVALVEQEGPVSRSATWNSAGQIRLHHSDLADARLAALAFDTFENWADVIGGDVGFRRTGFAFLVGEQHTGLLDDNVKLLARLGVDTTVLSPAEFATAHPGLNLQDVAVVAYEPRSGYADPARAARTLTDRAREHGAVVLKGAGGGRLRHSGGRVVGVDVGPTAVSAGEVVLAAGAWSGEVLARSGLPLVLPLRTRRVGLVTADGTDLLARPSLPMVIDDLTGTYFRPHLDDLVLFGVPLDSWDPAPEDANKPPEREREATARALIDRRLPGLAGAVRRTAVAAADGYTPDRRALIGPSSQVPGLYLATGFNGGGFKVAPSVGAAVAAELTGAGGRPELAPYRPDRFAAGRPVPAEPLRYLTM